MFTLSQISPTGGDCTALYKAILYKDYTVQEFVTEILTRREFGSITIDGECINSTYNFSYNDSNCESIWNYKGLLDLKVKRVTANGGWSRMDYTIHT